jgi:hypothetical protein
MVPDQNVSSPSHRYDVCPIPRTHRRLAEAHLLWHQTLERYNDPEAFRANLNATIEALRNVTFVLQNEKSQFVAFDRWYGPWQTRLKADASAKWLHDARTTVVHQGELDSYSTAEVRLLTWREETIATLTVPPEIPSSLLLQNLPLLNLLGNSPEKAEDLKDGVIVIERRWSAASLGTTEILEVLAQVYGLLSDLVLDAHIHLERCECIPAESGHPDFRTTYHRTGTLECMALGPGQRTQTFKVATRDEISFVQAVAPTGAAPHEAIRRYGLDEDSKLAPWETLDPARFAQRVLHSAKKILCRDRHHSRVMFIRDGSGAWHLLPIEAADNAEKHLLMSIIARFVETKGCDAIVEVGETWTTLAKPESGLKSSNVRLEMVRGEALFVMVATREGFLRVNITPFTRGPLGGIRLGETDEPDRMSLPHIRPVLDVWRRQGYTLLADGKATRRIWEPDPLDVCFCGGPRRFAECCRRHIPFNPSAATVEVKPATAAPDCGRAEELSRAAVAQYVIWVKQHTAGMMNVAQKAYKMFVEVDVPALEGYVLNLQDALRANGREELYVPQVRHIASVIGVPRLSVRLVALACRWFLNSGRMEEAILELDGLGDLDKVDDTLALITAVHVYDLPPKRAENLLLRAVSSAVHEEERWASQLELAEFLRASGRREEALELVGSVIAESRKSTTRPERHPEALILRWRITKGEDDFVAAKKAMQSGDDADRQRYGATLIDEGMYAEAELLLSNQIDNGEPTAKLLLADARVRGGRAASARDLLLSVQPGQISNRLQKAYAVACSIVALASGDDAMRKLAIRAIGALPPSAQDGDEDVRKLLRALSNESPAA